MSNWLKLFILIAAVINFAACSNDAKQDVAASADQVKNTLSGSADSSIVEIIHQDKLAVGHFGLGQNASAEEIAGWDIDIRPDGYGLPEGSGTVEDGEPLYEEKCASCHGSFGEGAQGYPVLAGGEDSLTEARPEKTVGSYWPYASTLWDYIHRAMPFQAPQSLPNDEVYAITAYVLYLNEIVEDDFELNKETFSTITMPNQDSFYRDDRPDVQAQRCMENCKSEPAKITSEPENSTYFADSTIQYTAPSAMATTATTVTVAETAKVESAGNTNTLGQDTYQAACALCHTAGLAGAPVTGDATQWQERLAKGEEALGQSSLNGIGAMPAKGGQAQLSDEAVLAAVKYMLDELGQ